MTDLALKALARRAGIALEWRDYANKRHAVSIATVRAILSALGFACDTREAIAESAHRLDSPALQPLLTATVGRPVDLQIAADRLRGSPRIIADDGSVTQAQFETASRLHGLEKPGYHTLEFGDDCVPLAVAPSRCVTTADIACDERLWGLTVQTYGLRSPGDCGIGDMGGVAALAHQAAKLKADALGVSPMHALFTANPNAYSPYSPSSRLFYNPLLADPQPLFGTDRMRKALANAENAGSGNRLADCALIDWPRASALKLRMFRCLFDDFLSSDFGAHASSLADRFLKFCETGNAPLRAHALFEALHAARVGVDGPGSHWRAWPTALRSPASDEVKLFAQHNKREVEFHCFLQWIADESLAAAQSTAKDAGMRIGLISDLAVGMSADGSHAWSHQHDILSGLEIGAPPDLYNQNGQNWGLTTFSPWALRTGGFASFIATLRAALRHAGGVRIDHVMGLMRLWVIPSGADPRDGAYLSFPLDDLLRLTALESLRHRAIIIGEDLGTVPPGFRELLSRTGIYGMQVLWFERKKTRFLPPQDWSPASAAMTSTHDLPTVAGWWHGHDIETREELGLESDSIAELETRQNDRKTLWRSFARAGAASAGMPTPSGTESVVDAAVQYVAQTPSQLALLPLEDALALEEQPNLPGTITEHPNWRRRYPGNANELLDSPQVRERLAPLIRRGER
jgi:4-alpha-glucanotransferase